MTHTKTHHWYMCGMTHTKAHLQEPFLKDYSNTRKHTHPCTRTHARGWWVTSHICNVCIGWDSEMRCKEAMSYVTHSFITSRTFMSHATHVYESSHTLKTQKTGGWWVTLHIWMSHVKNSWVASRFFMSHTLSREYVQYLVALFRETDVSLQHQKAEPSHELRFLNK